MPLGNLADARGIKTIVNKGFYVEAFVRNDLQLIGLPDVSCRRL